MSPCLAENQDSPPREFRGSVLGAGFHRPPHPGPTRFRPRLSRERSPARAPAGSCCLDEGVAWACPCVATCPQPAPLPLRLFLACSYSPVILNCRGRRRNG